MELETMRAELLRANVQRALYPLARECNVKGYAALSKEALADAILASGEYGRITAALSGTNGHAKEADTAEGDGGEADALADAIRRIAAGVTAKPAGIDEAAVKRIVAECLATSAIAKVCIVERPGKEPVDVGVQHKRFPLLLRIATAKDATGARLIPLLVGPPGTGKSTAAKALAKALGLERYAYTGALDSQYGLTGFIDAHGHYVRTPFRDVWEHGGVFLWDEIFASHPSALVVFNGAMGNGLCPFPDGMVARHKDCVLIAADNTTGHGGTAEFTGRTRQDAATLDRFCYLDWPIDEALENALSGNHAWRAAVRAARKVAVTRKLQGACISPRAILKGEAMLAAGVELADVMEATIRNGLADASFAEVREAAESAYREAEKS